MSTKEIKKKPAIGKLAQIIECEQCVICSCRGNTRRIGRAIAVQFLYGYFCNPAKISFEKSSSMENVVVLEEMVRRSPALYDEETKEFFYADDILLFSTQLFTGSVLNLAQIDEHIKKFSNNWKFERIGIVELAILRIAIYEMLYLKEVAVNIVINEALELAKIFADENSSAFIHGILDSIVQSEKVAEKPTDKVAEKPTDKVAEKSTDKIAEKNVEKTS